MVKVLVKDAHHRPPRAGELLESLDVCRVLCAFRVMPTVVLNNDAPLRIHHVAVSEALAWT